MVQLLKPEKRILTVPPNPATYFFHCQWVGRRFGKELIGITNDPFLQGLTEHIATGQGKLLLSDLLGREPRPDMALANQAVLRQTLPLTKFAPDDPVLEIGLFALASDTRGTSVFNTDIVKPRCL